MDNTDHLALDPGHIPEPTVLLPSPSPAHRAKSETPETREASGAASLQTRRLRREGEGTIQTTVKKRNAPFCRLRENTDPGKGSEENSTSRRLRAPHPTRKHPLLTNTAPRARGGGSEKWGTQIALCPRGPEAAGVARRLKQAECDPAHRRGPADRVPGRVAAPGPGRVLPSPQRGHHPDTSPATPPGCGAQEPEDPKTLQQHRRLPAPGAAGSHGDSPGPPGAVPAGTPAASPRRQDRDCSPAPVPAAGAQRLDPGRESILCLHPAGQRKFREGAPSGTTTDQSRDAPRGPERPLSGPGSADRPASCAACDRNPAQL